MNVVQIKKWDKKHEKTISEIHRVLSRYEIKVEGVCRKEIDKDIVRGVDLIICVGGDGTMLRVAQFVENELVMGVNSNVEESEGKLMNFNVNSFANGFERLMSGNIEIEEVTRLVVKIDEKEVGMALNEVYIGMKNAYETARYDILFNGKEEKQKSSGVIVSTGAGSTAWFSSAGGRRFGRDDKKARFIVREPYFGKLNKPSLLKGEIKEKIVLKSRMFGGVIVIDSIKEFNFEPGSVVEIGVGSKLMRMIKA